MRRLDSNQRHFSFTELWKIFRIDFNCRAVEGLKGRKIAKLRSTLSVSTDSLWALLVTVIHGAVCVGITILPITRAADRLSLARPPHFVRRTRRGAETAARGSSAC